MISVGLVAVAHLLEEDLRVLVDLGGQVGEGFSQTTSSCAGVGSDVLAVLLDSLEDAIGAEYVKTSGILRPCLPGARRWDGQVLQSRFQPVTRKCKQSLNPYLRLISIYSFFESTIWIEVCCYTSRRGNLQLQRLSEREEMVNEGGIRWGDCVLTKFSRFVMHDLIRQPQNVIVTLEDWSEVGTHQVPCARDPHI